jgi:hypothetical protein
MYEIILLIPKGTIQLWIMLKIWMVIALKFQGSHEPLDSGDTQSRGNLCKGLLSSLNTGPKYELNAWD